MDQIFAKDMWLERWAQLRHKDFVHRVCKEPGFDQNVRLK